MLDPEEFRKGLRAFTTGVTVVTVPDGLGGMHAMTASSFAAVSVTPQLAAINIAKRAKAHRLVTEATHYGINLLAETQATLANYFANRLDARHAPEYRWVDGVPILTGTMGWFACRRWAAYDGGDHTIFVGEAIALHRTDDAPLICSRGRFHQLGLRLKVELLPTKEESRHAAHHES
ncbi:MAG: flavin reductase family protein [Caulobacteraceae bacterium]